jgi:hypothetical protein
MDIEKSVFDEGDCKEKTNQDRVKAGQKEDRPTQFQVIVGEIDDRSSEGHRDNSEDEVFNLKFLSRDTCCPEGLEQILNAPIDIDTGKEGDQTKEYQKNERFFKKKAIIEDIS